MLTLIILVQTSLNPELTFWLTLELLQEEWWRGSKGYEKVKPLIMSTHPLGCGVYIRCRYQFEAV